MASAQMELLIAARGWHHSSWFGSYYPDDLPDDWQLSFYSNDFRAIVVPESDWLKLDPLEIERWLEDTPEEFLFYLELEVPCNDWEDVRERINALGDQLGGFLFQLQDVDNDLSVIAASLESAAEIAPVSLLLPDDLELSETGQKLLSEHKVECCWNVGEGYPSWAHSQLDSELAVARVVGDKTFTAREWREIIETCLLYGASNHSTKARRLLLMVDGDETPVGDLRNAMIIGEMLSLPEP